MGPGLTPIPGELLAAKFLTPLGPGVSPGREKETSCPFFFISFSHDMKSFGVKNWKEKEGLENNWDGGCWGPRDSRAHPESESGAKAPVPAPSPSSACGGRSQLSCIRSAWPRCLAHTTLTFNAPFPEGQRLRVLAGHAEAGNSLSNHSSEA